MINKDGQTRFARLVNNVAIGAQSSCERSAEFSKVIHIKTPGEASRCKVILPSHLDFSIHNMVDDHPKTLGPEVIRKVYEYAKPRNPLLIHCGAGMHRSCTVAVIALMARGLDIAGACQAVIKAACNYEEEPIFPYFTHAAMEEIRRVLG